VAPHEAPQHKFRFGAFRSRTPTAAPAPRSAARLLRSPPAAARNGDHPS
jgi:hypothetical protein